MLNIIYIQEQTEKVEKMDIILDIKKFIINTIIDCQSQFYIFI